MFPDFIIHWISDSAQSFLDAHTVEIDGLEYLSLEFLPEFIEEMTTFCCRISVSFFWAVVAILLSSGLSFALFFFAANQLTQLLNRLSKRKSTAPAVDK